MNRDIHIIYLNSGRMLLSKKAHSDWREIQNEHPDYMTSLGPWDVPKVIQFLADEFKNDLSAKSAERVRQFVDSPETVMEIFSD